MVGNFIEQYSFISELKITFCSNCCIADKFRDVELWCGLALECENFTPPKINTHTREYGYL